MLTGLTALEKRRERGDVIEFFKHFANLDEINWHKGPDLMAARPERTCRQMNSQSVRREAFPSSNANNFCHFVNVRHEFFLNRVSEYWNKLPNDVVSAPTLNSFKARYDKLQERLLQLN